MEQTMNATSTDFLTYGDWTDFNEKVKALQESDFMSEEQLCEALELSSDLYFKVINYSIRAWRSSPSKSLFPALGKMGLRLPKQGELVFDSHLLQTRFFTLLDDINLIHHLHFSHVRNQDGEKMKINGVYALTCPKENRKQKVDSMITYVLKCIYAYFLYCRKQEDAGLKKPKKLYRGIRFQDIWRNPVIQEKIASLDSKPYSQWRKNVLDVIMDYIYENGLEAFTPSPLVSFTSSLAVAKYFANKEGLVIEITTDQVEIMTSVLHDERFAEKDYYSKRDEKEFIVRLEPTLRVSNILVYDLDYFLATNNPLSVNLFDHDNKEAHYELNGIKIKAKCIWTSNTTKSLTYYNLSDECLWGCSSREFKTKYGITPVISNKNLKEIKNFTVSIVNR